LPTSAGTESKSNETRPLLPRAEKLVLVLEAIGDGKVRLTRPAQIIRWCSSKIRR
jgi:hypothetical protein